MKDSIKREQSQAGLSFAERLRVGEPCSGMRKNFRPQVKNRLLLLLVLLMTAATGAWAQEQWDVVWDFTAWSTETVTALKADAAASKLEGWSDVEKMADAEAGADPTEAAKDNCFWFAGTVNEDGSLSANGAVIKELKGLKFNSDYAAKRSLAIAVNYPSTNLGDYAGGAYLWLGGGGSKQTFPCFTIPGVKAGSKITIEVESNKPSSARGIGLYKNSYAAGNLIGEQFTPTAKEAKTWDITEDCDVVVWNTHNCHIYTIKVKAPAAPAGYTVSMKDGVKDADKWTITPNPAEEGQTVTLQYNGRLKVKGVKATSEAAAPSVPDGALSGVFSVSDGKQVYFSKGNLRYESSKWSFFDNQYDYYNSYSEDAWDHFGWSTSATDYGKNTSTVNSDYSGDFVDWGATMGTGWRMLTSDEWTYLLKTRSASTVGGTENGRCAKAKVNNVRGVILFPDTYTHPDGVTAPVGVNAEDATGWNGNSYTAADWTKMESAGCVFLPAAGYRSGSSVSNAGSVGDYSSATPNGTEKAYELYFSSGSLNTASVGSRRYGLSVRLVSEVTASDAEQAKTPATVTTAPTGAAIVGVGKTTALVSGGVAEGGTLMYKVTTENTKPTSTEGFSDAVPTAQTITASGKVYVWYYVKGDDSHSDSEIAATAIEVPVADVVWDATNASDLYVDGYGSSFVMDGVTLSGNDGEVYAWWDNGLNFSASEIVGYTFTAPTGKAFTKIEMIANGSDEWNSAALGTGWAFNNPTVTWTGSAASTVGLLTDDVFEGAPVNSIGFYLSE